MISNKNLGRVGLIVCIILAVIFCVGWVFYSIVHPTSSIPPADYHDHYITTTFSSSERLDQTLSLFQIPKIFDNFFAVAIIIIC